MNMSKDESILDLLRKLGLSRRGWTTVDNWEADLCAIGIASTTHPLRLVYVSTFNRESDRYDYMCEEPTGPELEDYKTINQGQNVDFGKLLEAIEEHLK